MSQFEGKFQAGTSGALDDRDLLALLVGETSKSIRRSEIVARYLSGEAGWRDAAAVLGGAFAGHGNLVRTELSGGKEQ